MLDLKNEVTKMFKLLSDNLNLKIPMLIIKEKLWSESLTSTASFTQTKFEVTVGCEVFYDYIFVILLKG